ncbi:DEKNAAC102726 [Brettanomyces naardenensis]|uniref:DEKNAAC102726 n=1 Tax=Brettanomyces naardenensis TaxID=13370 RepID=A0A448YKM8_BRENA|nr:DEKNAAC102726 [Brettanomyces naardenensis]
MLFLFSILPLIAGVLSLAARQTNNSIDLSIVGSWKTTPFKLNVLESVSSEEPTLYEPLVEKLLGLEVTNEDGEIEVGLKDEYCLTDQQYYSYAMSLVQSNITRSFIDVNLANRVDSPRIEAHYKYFRDFIAPKKHCSSGKAFIIQGSEVYCNPTDVFALKTAESSLDLEPMDHLLGDSKNFYVLYGDFSVDSFREMFSYLYQSMLSGKLSFIWRYIPDETVQDYELLGGYGIDLTLKRTDYIVIDDRGFTEEQQKKLKFEGSDKVVTREEVDEEEDFWEEYKPDVPKLKADDLKDLAIRVSKFVLDLDSSDGKKLELLTGLVEDFPKFAANFAGLHYNDSDLRMLALESLQDSQIDIPDGLYINNAVVPAIKSDMFAVLKILKRELKYTEIFREIGINSSSANSILSTFASYEYNFAKMPYRRYDYSDFSSSIVYFNNIEEDYPYSSLVSAREAYSEEPPLGQIPPARENIYETVFIFDLTDPAKLYYSLAMINQVLSKGVPERVGIVPIASSDLGKRAAEEFLKVSATSGSNAALKFLHELNHYVSTDKLDPKALESLEQPDTKDVKHILRSIRSFQNNFKLGLEPRMVVNGVIFPFDENWQLAIRQLSFDVYHLYESFQRDMIPANMPFRDYLLSGSLKQRVPYLIPDNIQSSQTNFLSVPSLQHILLLDNFTNGVATIVNHKCKSATCYRTLSPKTLTLVGGFDDRNFRHQISEAIKYVEGSNNIKLRIVDLGHTKEFEAFKERLASEGITTALQFLSIVESVGIVASGAENVGKIFGISRNSGIHLILNGRSMDITGYPTVTPEQFDILMEFEGRLRLTPLWKMLKRQKSAQSVGKSVFKDKYDWFEYTTWLLSDTQFKSDEEFVYEGLPRYGTDVLNEALSLHIPAKSDPLIYVSLVIDPVSEGAQKYLSMLSLFEEMDFVDIRIHLRPAAEIESVDIKRLYRGMFKSKARFNGTGAIDRDSLKVAFNDVPEKTLFTLNVDDPQSWTVSIKEANADLDNVKLDLTGPVSGVYELQNILVEGYASDITAPGMRPIGLPVELVNELGQASSDTNIMANFGYLQLKANPGRWTFRIKPDSQGSRIYSLIGLENKDSREVAVQGYPLYILSLNGPTMFPKFTKKPGKEDEYLVEVGEQEDEGKKSLFARIKNSVSFGSKKNNQADINIFTVASGHLYERFLGIMTASVMAHTRHTVKFWLIENYMSPQLKRDLPILAEHYGFKYELVTYKWPSWLRHQREKQRVIWGYKILFLDVLFPQDLDKIIFVDSDQIVRTDMKELVDLDLEGAPYGFTPMGDSRDEMEGFRFWKQGYWKKLLGDKYKYHISALYVVDLDKFRRIAAGDILRHHYQQLSNDPESLSNLDQDLPNNLQDVIKIHSLPQNWLWCETWCSDDSLKDARTIDLCNNPLTKEPKLDRARRQIPEWTTYDDEISLLIRQSTENDSVISEATTHDEL